MQFSQLGSDPSTDYDRFLIAIEMSTVFAARNRSIESIRDQKWTNQCEESPAIGLDYGDNVAAILDMRSDEVNEIA